MESVDDAMAGNFVTNSDSKWSIWSRKCAKRGNGELTGRGEVTWITWKTPLRAYFTVALWTAEE
jgi:hypothetical protein